MTEPTAKPVAETTKAIPPSKVDVRVDVNVYLHSSVPGELREALDIILKRLTTIFEKENQIMATLDETLAAVTDESTKEDSLIALVVGIKAQLDAALAGGVSPATQAKVDAIFAGVQANAAKVQTAIDANTPAPTPAP